MSCMLVWFFFFFFKQKTAYEMRISDWSSDVCSSDLQLDGSSMNETITKFGHPATLIAEYEHWVVLLRPAQPTLGALILAAKSDATAFGDLQIGRASCRERVCQYV